MKILMLVSELDVGGAETHIETLCRELSRHAVELVVASGGGRVAGRLEKNGIRHITIKKPSKAPTALLAAWRDIYKIIKEEKPDIVHAHTRLTALAAHAVCRAIDVPMVTTAHALFSMTPTKARLSCWGELTLAVSEDIKEHLVLRGGVSPDKIRVIENGVFVPSETRIGEARGGHSVLFVSRMDSDCSLGAYLLCEIAPYLAEKYPDVSIILVGGGDELEGVKEAARRANRRVGRAVVKIAGRVDDPTVFLGDAAVFVGVSRAALEAMAHATPVILLGNEGFLGLLDEKNVTAAKATNFCARGGARASADALFWALERFFSLSEERRATLSAFCRETVKKHCSAELMAQRTLGFYREAIDAHRADGRKRDSATKSNGCAKDNDATSGEKNKEKTTRAQTKKRILLCGYYGFGNLGDDAILASILKELAPMRDSIEVCVLGSKKLQRGLGKSNSTESRVKKPNEKDNKTKHKATESKHTPRPSCRGAPLSFSASPSSVSASSSPFSLSSLPFSDSSLLFSDPPLSFSASSSPFSNPSFPFSVAPLLSPLAVVREMKCADVFVFGGGSLLQNKTSDRSLLYYLFVVALAKKHCKKQVMLSNGIGPITDVRYRHATLAAVSSFDKISVRDTRSQRALARALPKREITLFPDPALLLLENVKSGQGHPRTPAETHTETSAEIHTETSAEIYAETHTETHAESRAEPPAESCAEIYAETHTEIHAETHANPCVASNSTVSRVEKTSTEVMAAGDKRTVVTKRKLAVCLCGGELARCGITADAVADALRAALRALCAEPFFIVMNERADLPVTKEVASLLEVSVLESSPLAAGFEATVFCPRDADELLDLLARADLSLCMRYHAALFSVGAGIPTLALGGDRKLSGFCADVGAYPAVPTALLCDREKLGSSLSRALSHFEKNGAKIEEKVEKMRSLCSKSFKELINYINTLDFEV